MNVSNLKINVEYQVQQCHEMIGGIKQDIEIYEEIISYINCFIDDDTLDSMAYNSIKDYLRELKNIINGIIVVDDYIVEHCSKMISYIGIEDLDGEFIEQELYSKRLALSYAYEDINNWKKTREFEMANGTIDSYNSSDNPYLSIASSYKMIIEELEREQKSLNDINARTSSLFVYCNILQEKIKEYLYSIENIIDEAKLSNVPSTNYYRDEFLTAYEIAVSNDLVKRLRDYDGAGKKENENSLYSVEEALEYLYSENVQNAIDESHTLFPQVPREMIEAIILEEYLAYSNQDIINEDILSKPVEIINKLKERITPIIPALDKIKEKHASVGLGAIRPDTAEEAIKKAIDNGVITSYSDIGITKDEVEDYNKLIDKLRKDSDFNAKVCALVLMMKANRYADVKYGEDLFSITEEQSKTVFYRYNGNKEYGEDTNSYYNVLKQRN